MAWPAEGVEWGHEISSLQVLGCFWHQPARVWCESVLTLAQNVLVPLR